jgi:hypothetical protein
LHWSSRLIVNRICERDESGCAEINKTGGERIVHLNQNPCERVKPARMARLSSPETCFRP